jgi:hypothetical protein
MTVLITLTTAGTDTGPFNLYSNVDGYVSAFETGVSKAALVAGYSSALVPNGTTIIRIKSTGTCVNYIDVNVVTTTTTTTTGTPTTTTTTTSAPPPTTTTTTSLLGDTFYIINSSTNSTITNITVSAASFYFLNVGMLPVVPSQTASGTHSSLTSANIDVDVTQSLGNACLKLYVNNIVVSQLNVGSTGIYTFTTITFGTSDLVEFEIVDGTC